MESRLGSERKANSHESGFINPKEEVVKWGGDRELLSINLILGPAGLAVFVQGRPQKEHATHPTPKVEAIYQAELLAIEDDMLLFQISAFICWGHDALSLWDGRLMQQMDFYSQQLCLLQWTH